MTTIADVRRRALAVRSSQQHARCLGIFPDYAAPIVRNLPGGREPHDGAVGNAVANFCPERQEFRS
jgi:hypothetical protein